MLFKKRRAKIKNKRANGAIGTAVVILSSIVAGAIVLTGTVGIVNNVVKPKVSSKVDSMYATETAEGGSGGSGGSSGGVVVPIVEDIELSSSFNLGDSVDGILSTDVYPITNFSTLKTGTYEIEFSVKKPDWAGSWGEESEAAKIYVYENVKQNSRSFAYSEPSDNKYVCKKLGAINKLDLDESKDNIVKKTFEITDENANWLKMGKDIDMLESVSIVVQRPTMDNTAQVKVNALRKIA